MKSMYDHFVGVFFLPLSINSIPQVNGWAQQKKVFLKTVPGEITVMAGETIQVEVNAVDELCNGLDADMAFFNENLIT